MLLSTSEGSEVGLRQLWQVTHRLNDAASSHHIFVMQGGRLVEEGCHDSLVASRGIYARLGASPLVARNCRYHR